MFIDETWASTNMARRYGRAPRGWRLRAGVPHGRWKTITFVAGLRTSGVVAPFVLDGPINRAAFEAYVEKVLVPQGPRMKPIYASDRSEICSEIPPFAGFCRVSAPVTSPKVPQA